MNTSQNQTDEAIQPCPFCGILPIPECGKVLYELHHKPGCFLGGRIRFGCSELERWNGQPAAKRLKELEKESEELKRTIDTITTDENYVGGVQYWIRKHDKRLGENIEVCVQLSEIRAEYKNALEALKEISTWLRALRHSMDSEKPFPSVEKVSYTITQAETVLSTPAAIAMKG